MTKPNVPDAMIKNGIAYRIISDQIGSVRLVVRADNSQVVEQIDYDEFGQVLNDTNPNFMPFGFAGGFHQDNLGEIGFGARTYDAETGRWTTRDPLLFGGGDTNLYGYVVDDPVNRIDPSGELPPPVWTGIGGGAYSGARNSSSCTSAGRAADTLIGASTGFAAGFIAGTGVGAGTFLGYVAGVLGGTAAGAGPAFIDLNGPNGDQLLGNKCGCP